MATITSTPTGGSLTVSGTTQVSGTISWSKPTVPSGATISSCVLTGTATASMSKGSATITVNGTTVTSGTSFTINLGTANNTTSVTTTAKGGNKNSSGTVSFSNLVYTVTYELAKPTYTVTFKDWNGTTLKTQTVEEGSSATAPSNPSRQGYEFTGWDTSFNNVTSNITVTAQYRIQTFSVIFKDWDGTVLKSLTVNYGASAIAPSDPFRDGYEFTGWDKDFSNITSDLTVMAQYNKLPIEWAGGLGTVATDLRAHASGDNYSHDSYTVNLDWENESFDIVITNDINFSDSYAINPATIGDIIIGDVVCSICFYKGDDSAGICIDALDSFEECVFNKSTFPYTVSFTKNGIYIKATSISGTGNEITIIPNSENIYDGSNKSIRIVDDHIKHSALTYAVSMENSDYDIYFDLAVSKHTQLELVDKTIALRPVSATQDSGYNNTWTNVENTYDTDTSTSGTIIVTGSSQSGFKRKYVDTIFNFDNTIPSNAVINSAVLTVRAKQSATTNLNMTVSVDDNEVISSTLLGQSSANYTADVATIIKDLNQLNINLTSAATSNRTFTLYDVRIDVDYTVYEEIPEEPEEPEVPENPIVYYTVTFKDYDGTVLSTQTIEEGYDAVAPADPTRDGYIFKRWSKSFTNVSSNLEVIALYESVIVPDEPEEPSTSSITNIKIGDTVLQNLYIGGLPITKIYIGDYILYEAVKKHSPAASIAPTKIEFDVETEVEFEGDGDYIDTKVDLFDDGNDWSFLIDFTDEGKAEWSDSLFILHNFFEGPDGELQGLNIQKTGEAQGTRLSFQVNDNFYATKQLSNGVNTRLVFTFKYPGELHMYYNDPDIDAYLGGNGHYKFAFNEYFDLDKCNLHLACWYNESQGGVGRFWRGIINEFIIWNKTALSDEQVQYILQNKAKN